MEPLFIINTITSKDEPPRARHQVAYALAKKYSVIFVTANKTGFLRSELVQVSKNLKFYIPYFPIDYRIRIRISWINIIYQKWLFHRLKKKYPDSTVINFDFTAKYISQFFFDNIYYCNDDHIGVSRRINYRWIANYHEKCEKMVAKYSRFCIGTSKFLVERLTKYNHNSYEIRLGAPHIENEIRYNSRPEDKSKNIIVGIVGYFKTLDFELLELLLKNQDLFFTLVGPMSKKFNEMFKASKNVRITGKLVDEKLFDEVNKFDVGLIPYQLNSKVERTPNKLWLYLAIGKPVVISNISGIKDWEFPEKFVYRANSNEEFLELIKRAHAEDNSQLSIERMNFARLNTWDIRINEFLNINHKLKIDN